MIFNIAGKTAAQIDAIIEAFATTEQAELMGFAGLLPVIDGDALELIGVGYVVEAVEAFDHERNNIGQALRVMSDRQIAHLNTFAA